MGRLAHSAQQRELLRDRAQPGGVPGGRALNVTLEIEGELSPAELGRAVQRSVDAHPALRTVFEAGEQRIREVAPVKLLTEELPPADDTRERAFTRAEEFCRGSFAPDDLPRLRSLHLRTAGDGARPVLVLAIDPLVCDAWSANIVADELRSALAALLEGGTPEPIAADPFLDVWRERSAVPGLDADRIRVKARERLAEYSGMWGGAVRPDRLAPTTLDDSSTQAMRDLSDDVAEALQERCRQLRASVLAPALLALQLVQADPLMPRAVVSTLVGRETDAEWAAVGHLATDVWIPIRLRGLTLAEAVRSIRDAIFDTLTDAPVYWREVTDALAYPSGGSTVSVLYLPSQLSGGNRDPAPGRSTREDHVRRAAVSICPTGADVDLYLVEHPPVDGRGRTPALRLGGELHRREAGIDLDALLDAWADLLTRMARTGAWRDAAWPAMAGSLANDGATTRT